jgi:hypothetical protein
MVSRWQTGASRAAHLLSGGRHVVSVAVLWPSAGLVAEGTPSGGGAGERIEAGAAAVAAALSEAQIDFDFVDELALGPEGVLRCGETAYRALVLPPVSLVAPGTLEALRRLTAGGFFSFLLKKCAGRSLIRAWSKSPIPSVLLFFHC